MNEEKLNAVIRIVKSLPSSSPLSYDKIENSRMSEDKKFLACVFVAFLVETNLYYIYMTEVQKENRWRRLPREYIVNGFTEDTPLISLFEALSPTFWICGAFSIYYASHSDEFWSRWAKIWSNRILTLAREISQANNLPTYYEAYGCLTQDLDDEPKEK